MRLIQISDIHFGTEDQHALHAATSYLQSESYDGLIVCGDLTQRGKNVEFDAAKRWLEQFDVPQLIVAGNHDTPLLNIVERARQPFTRFNSRFATYADHIDIDDWRILGMNTARGWQKRRNWAEGVVNLDDLKVHLDKASERSIFVCHHPFESPPGSPLRTSTRRGLEAGILLGASHVNVLLSGHVHAPSATVWKHPTGKYLAISSGTLSTRLRHSPPSFNCIEICDGYIDVSVHDLSQDSTSARLLGKWDLETLEPITPRPVNVT